MRREYREKVDNILLEIDDALTNKLRKQAGRTLGGAATPSDFQEKLESHRDKMANAREEIDSKKPLELWKAGVDQLLKEAGDKIKEIDVLVADMQKKSQEEFSKRQSIFGGGRKSVTPNNINSASTPNSSSPSEIPAVVKRAEVKRTSEPSLAELDGLMKSIRGPAMPTTPVASETSDLAPPAKMFAAANAEVKSFKDMQKKELRQFARKSGVDQEKLDEVEDDEDASAEQKKAAIHDLILQALRHSFSKKKISELTKLATQQEGITEEMVDDALEDGKASLIDLIMRETTPEFLQKASSA
jgi:hypothetical protein